MNFSACLSQSLSSSSFTRVRKIAVQKIMKLIKISLKQMLQSSSKNKFKKIKSKELQQFLLRQMKSKNTKIAVVVSNNQPNKTSIWTSNWIISSSSKFRVMAKVKPLPPSTATLCPTWHPPKPERKAFCLHTFREIIQIWPMMVVVYNNIQRRVRQLIRRWSSIWASDKRTLKHNKIGTNFKRKSSIKFRCSARLMEMRLTLGT